MRQGAVLLGLAFVAGVVAYRLMGRSWLDALYMVVITISTVGFGETSALRPAEQWVTIAVILTGISTAVFTIGGFFQMIVEGEIDRSLHSGRNLRAIDRLKDHVIVCGFGRIGELLAEQLHKNGQTFVVVDIDPGAVAEATNLGYLALAGDATEEDLLCSAGVQRARCLVTALSNDAANVFITLTSRNLNPGLQIIARGEHLTTQKKLLQAGANRVVLPAMIGASRMSAMITHPSTVELMELVAGQSVLDVEINELVVAAGSSLVGQTIRQFDIRRKHELLVVAVKQASGAMLFNPDADLSLAAGDVIVVMGRADNIERFRSEFGL